MIYDVTKKNTFCNIEKWIDVIKDSIDINKVGFIVVANNCDEEKENWEVDEKMEEKLIETYNIKIMRTSAKNNINVNETFASLVDMMLKLGLGKKWSSDEDDDNENKEQSKSITLENNINKRKVNNGCYNKSK